MEQALEQLIRQRAAGRCEYSHIPAAYHRPSFEIEHIIARKHGGQTIASNLAAACFACNHRKGNDLTGLDPETRKLTKLFHPRRMKWERHFRWDGPFLVGRTATGRTTIAVLGINLPLRVRLRQELIDEGNFP
jgi:hypothetical protein